MRVSPICIGAVADPRTVAAAFEAGINFFLVTTDMHWPLYEATRRGLRALLRSRPGVRDEVVVAGVCYPTQPVFNHMPFEELIAALPGLDRIDVGVIGGTYGTDFMDRLPVYHAHRRTRFAGMRAIAASFHDRAAVAPAVNHGLVDLAFLRYNPAHPGARTDVFPLLTSDRRPPVFNFTNTHGWVSAARRAALGVPRDVWQPEVADCYRFALSVPGMNGLLCGPSTPRQVHALVDALAQGPLSDDETHVLVNLARLDAGEATLDTDAD